MNGRERVARGWYTPLNRRKRLGRGGYCPLNGRERVARGWFTPLNRRKRVGRGRSINSLEWEEKIQSLGCEGEDREGRNW